MSSIAIHLQIHVQYLCMIQWISWQKMFTNWDKHPWYHLFVIMSANKWRIEKHLFFNTFLHYFCPFPFLSSQIFFLSCILSSFAYVTYMTREFFPDKFVCYWILCGQLTVFTLMMHDMLLVVYITKFSTSCAQLRLLKLYISHCSIFCVIEKRVK